MAVAEEAANREQIATQVEALEVDLPRSAKPGADVAGLLMTDLEAEAEVEAVDDIKVHL